MILDESAAGLVDIPRKPVKFSDIHRAFDLDLTIQPRFTML